jgi:hypothetical protein
MRVFVNLLIQKAFVRRNSVGPYVKIITNPSDKSDCYETIIR